MSIFDWRIYYRAYHTNIKSQIAFSSKQARIFDVRIKMLLFSALKQCHLDYAFCAWYTELSKCFEKEITIMPHQNS